MVTKGREAVFINQSIPFAVEAESPRHAKGGVRHAVSVFLYGAVTELVSA